MRTAEHIFTSERPEVRELRESRQIDRGPQRKELSLFRRMTQQIAQVANADTPADVNVPATPSGLAVWALRAWGPWGAILCLLCVILWLYVGQIAETNKIQGDTITAQRAEIQNLYTTIHSLESMMKKQ